MVSPTPDERGPTQERLVLTMLFLLLLTALLFVLDILRGHTDARLLPFALISTVAMSGFVMTYLRTRAAWALNSMVALVTVLLVWSLDSGSFSTVLSFSLLLPTICALLFSSTRIVVSTGVLTYLIILWRADFHGAAADLGNAAFYGLLVAGLVLGRMGLTRALQAAQAANAQRTQLNAALESQVIARTADLHAALTQVEEVMQARSATMLEIVHDLRNYTQHMRGAALSLEWSYADRHAGIALAPDAEPALLLGALHGAIDRVAEFADVLADAALLEQRQLPLAVAPCPLDVLLPQVVLPLRPMFEREHVALYIQPPPQGVVVMADVTQLRRVLDNVLGNALKFTMAHRAARGAPAAAVTVAWRSMTEENQAFGQITITDTGIGIDRADMVRLGARFARGHSFVAGTGVGLHFAMRVVESLGGRLAITSPGRGRGTSVAITLPVAAASALPAGYGHALPAGSAVLEPI